MTHKNAVPDRMQSQSRLAEQVDEAILRKPTAGQMLRVLAPSIPSVVLSGLAVWDISARYWNEVSPLTYFLIVPIIIVGLAGWNMALGFWLSSLCRDRVPEPWAVTRQNLMHDRRTAIHFVALIAIFSFLAFVLAPLYPPTLH